MSRINFVFSGVEYWKSFIISGPDLIQNSSKVFLKYSLNQQTTKITGLRAFISWKADGHDRDFCSSEPAISYSCSVVKTTEVRDSLC